MSGSLKDALEKSGHATPTEKTETTPAKPSKEWLHELPEDDGKPHVPFEAPALTKPKPSTKK